MNEERLATLKREIDAVVDSWVSTVLKDRLIGGTNRSAPKSLWDRLKQGIANWWYGPQGEKENPYRWQNRFGGSLGVSESFNPSMFTLHEYSDIKGIVESLERTINESSEEFDKLKLAQIIRSAAVDLKAMLFNALKDFSPAANPRPVGPQSSEAPPAATPSEKGSVSSGTVTVPSPAKPKANSASAAGNTSSSGASVAPKKEKSARKRSTKSNAEKTTGGGASSATASVDQSSAAATAATAAASSEEKGDSKGSSEHENPELTPYLEKDGVKSLRRVGEKVANFLEKLSGGESRKRNDLLLWWDKVWKDNKKITNKEERMEDIHAKLVSTNQYVEQIAKIAGISSQTVKQLMIEFIKEEDVQ